MFEHLVTAELVRIEAGRFDLGLVERLIFDVVNGLTTGRGLEGLRVEKNWSSLADAINRPRNHVGAKVNGERGLVAMGALSCVADDVGYLLAVNYDFERWRYKELASHGAHWHRQNALRRVNGCTEWLWSREDDLTRVLAATHRERWQERAASVIGRDAPVLVSTERVMSAPAVPSSGTFPESGNEFEENRSGVGQCGFTRVNIGRNAPKQFREKCRSNVARARALEPNYNRDSNPIGTTTDKVVSRPVAGKVWDRESKEWAEYVRICMDVDVVQLKDWLRSGIREDYERAARAIIHPHNWEDGRPEHERGEAGKWIASWIKGGRQRDCALRVMEAMVEDGWPLVGDFKKFGARARGLWARFGGIDLVAISTHAHTNNVPQSYRNKGISLKPNPSKVL